MDHVKDQFQQKRGKAPPTNDVIAKMNNKLNTWKNEQTAKTRAVADRAAAVADEALTTGVRATHPTPLKNPHPQLTPRQLLTQHRPRPPCRPRSCRRKP